MTLWLVWKSSATVMEYDLGKQTDMVWDADVESTSSKSWLWIPRQVQAELG